MMAPVESVILKVSLKILLATSPQGVATYLGSIKVQNESEGLGGLTGLQ